MVVIIDLMGDEETIVIRDVVEVQSEVDKERVWREIAERMPQPQLVPVEETVKRRPVVIPHIH